MTTVSLDAPNPGICLMGGFGSFTCGQAQPASNSRGDSRLAAFPRPPTVRLQRNVPTIPLTSPETGWQRVIVVIASTKTHTLANEQSFADLRVSESELVAVCGSCP